jgi:Protein of unknown function (DUF4238)
MLGQFRSNFEPKWDAAVDALQNGRMCAEDKFIIAGYWANLNVTTPTWRTIGAGLFEKELRAILPITKDPPALENAKMSVDPNYIKALVTKNLWRSAWQFYNQQWSIVSNDTAFPFLTSDNPSAILPPEVKGGPAARVLPLSPNLCVATRRDMSKMPEEELTPAVLPPPKGSITYLKPDAILAKFVNRLTVLNAENLVFSRTASSGVEALVPGLWAAACLSTRSDPSSASSSSSAFLRRVVSWRNELVTRTEKGEDGEPVMVLMPRVTILDADKISDEAAAAVAEVPPRSDHQQPTDLCARFSARSACRGAAGKSLGQT